VLAALRKGVTLLILKVHGEQRRRIEVEHFGVVGLLVLLAVTVVIR
jgi:hypothetical protein